MESRYSDGTALTPNEITGILTASMFAGPPHELGDGGVDADRAARAIRSGWRAWSAELDALYARDGGAHAIRRFREVPVLESVLKEVLRLHPPLVILMRGVLARLRRRGRDDSGRHRWSRSRRPSRIASRSSFRDPERFDPEPLRRRAARRTRRRSRGSRSAAGHHRCSGAAFAIMQLKAITMSLLRRFTFELLDPPDSLRPGLHEDGRAGRASRAACATGAATDVAATGGGRVARRRREPTGAGRCGCGSTSASARGTRSACRRRPRCSG